MISMMEKEKLFSEGKITPTIFKLAIPLVVSQIINVLYNVVDRIFISYMPDVGQQAFGGLNVCFPIIMIVSAFAALFGMGGAPIASIKLGEGDHKSASKTLHTAFVCLIVSGIVLTVVVAVFQRPLLTLFGAKSDVIDYASDYLIIYAFGTISVMLSLGLNSFASAQGFTVTAMLTVLIGAVLNLILDPILILVCDMGVKGAAIATVISQTVSAIWIVCFLAGKKPILRIRLKECKISPKIALNILALGAAPFVMQATESLVQITFNLQIARYAGDEYLLYLNMISTFLTVMQIIVLPLNGIAQGAAPLISFNYGSGDTQRVRKAFRILCLMTFGYSFALYLVILAFPNLFISIFNHNDAKMLAVGANMMRIFFLGLSFMGIQTACQNTFMALKQPVISLLLAMLRKIVLLIPLTLILPLSFGINGVFYAEPVSDCIAIATTAIVFALTFRKILSKRVSRLDRERTAACVREENSAAFEQINRDTNDNSDGASSAETTQNLSAPQSSTQDFATKQIIRSEEVLSSDDPDAEEKNQK